jgi:hypothetical protein
MSVTDTPIYDQIRKELRERPEPVTSSRSRTGGESGQSVSVWALIDRTQRANDPRR